MSFEEQPLPHSVGNDGAVVRVGGTVRRPAGPQSPAVAAFLAHLEARGFEGAPRHLGWDEDGREVLTYVEGDVPGGSTVPEWALTDEALVSVAELMRRLHDASEGFLPPEGARWEWPPHPDHATGRVAHKDPCRDNLVFRGGRAYALIDFDWAGPATPAWEMAGVVSHWVLQLPGDRVGRFRTACAAYGLDPAAVVEATLVRADWGMALVEEKVRAGHPGFVAMWKAGLPAKNAARRDWVRDHAALLAQRLDG